jgi:hypothetical protein
VTPRRPKLFLDGILGRDGNNRRGCNVKTEKDRAGHWDVKLLRMLDPLGASIVWESLAPWVQKQRAATGDDWLLQDFEWLAGVMAEMNRRAGLPAVTSATIKIGIERSIPIYQERIRAAETLRTVILAQPVAMTLPRPTRSRSKRPVSSPAAG